MAGLPQNYKKDTSKVFRCKEALCDTFSAKRCWQYCHLTGLLGLRKETLFALELLQSLNMQIISKSNKTFQ